MNQNQVEDKECHKSIGGCFFIRRMRKIALPGRISKKPTCIGGCCKIHSRISAWPPNLSSHSGSMKKAARKQVPFPLVTCQIRWASWRSVQQLIFLFVLHKQLLCFVHAPWFHFNPTPSAAYIVHEKISWCQNIQALTQMVSSLSSRLNKSLAIPGPNTMEST